MLEKVNSNAFGLRLIYFRGRFKIVVFSIIRVKEYAAGGGSGGDGARS